MSSEAYFSGTKVRWILDEELVRKPEDKIVIPPVDETAWLDERARQRGVDYSAYK